MTWQRASYDAVRKRMRPGDVIAYADKEGVSGLILAATRGPVSHVGVVVRSRADAWSADEASVSPQVIESGSEPKGIIGVGLRWMDERMRNYDGNIWWLPLGDAVRARVDVERFTAFLVD